MAYSAGLGETDPRYYDTARPQGPLAHPLFPVCYEWPLAQPLRARPALAPLFARLLHAEHQLTLQRAPRAGETLQVTARIAGVAQRKPGAYVLFRFEARDAAGALVSASDMGALYRGVELDGPARGEAQIALAAHDGRLEKVAEVPVAATAAHVYTECARIWNPIHTDCAYARAAGLPGLILHGTATLALSVSRALQAFGADPGAVRGVRCRFAGMVLMPSTVSVHAAASGKNLAFETRNARGEPVITRGLVSLGDA